MGEDIVSTPLRGGAGTFAYRVDVTTLLDKMERGNLPGMAG